MNNDLIVTIGVPSKVKDKDAIGPIGIAFKTIIPKKKEGKPTVMTPEVLAKLQDAFLHGLSDRKACIVAGISPDALYDYQNRTPGYAEQKEEWKSRPDITAHYVLVKNIDGNLDQARWWANHRIDEFAPKGKLDISGDVTTRAGLTPEMAKVVEEMNSKMREAIAAPHKQQ